MYTLLVLQREVVFDSDFSAALTVVYSTGKVPGCVESDHCFYGLWGPGRSHR